MNSDDKRIGISLCLTSMAAYAIQDGITKVLVSGIPATQIVMIRCWVLLLLALVFAASDGASGSRPGAANQSSRRSGRC